MHNPLRSEVKTILFYFSNQNIYIPPNFNGRTFVNWKTPFYLYWKRVAKNHRLGFLDDVGILGLFLISIASHTIAYRRLLRFGAALPRSPKSNCLLGRRIRLYLSTIPTYNSHFNSRLNYHFLLSRSGNSSKNNSHFWKKNSLFYLIRSGNLSGN